MAVKRIRLTNGEIKWQVRVWENGRGSRRINRRFDRRTDAEAFLIEFEEKLRELKSKPSSNCTFSNRIFNEEADYWLKDGELRFSVSHLKRAKAVVAELAPHFGDFTMDRFTPELLTAYQQSEKAKGLENATVNRKTEVMTSIINFSVKHRRIPYSPAQGFRKLAKSTAEMKFWDREEATGFLAFANERYPDGSENRWVYVVYLLALNTSMRAGEIWGLKPMDIARDQRSINVRRQFNRVTLDFGNTKSKKSRFVPCNAELARELSLLIAKRSIKSDETVFMNEVRKPIWHENFVARRYRSDVKAWGGRMIRFHDLRHSAATMMIAGGVDLKTVKEICGHADIGTTMTYVHLIAGAIERVAQIFSVTPRAQAEEGETREEAKQDSESKLKLVKRS